MAGEDNGANGAGPSSTSADPSRPASTARYRSLLPAKWQRLQQQLEGRPIDLPASGANLSLEDLIKNTEQRLAEVTSDVVDTDIEEPFEPGQKVPGWVGTPDPTIYARGTNYLTPEQLQEEIAKGNVIATEDWRKAIQDLEPWQKQLFQGLVAQDFLYNRAFVEIPGEDGKPAGKVSVVDLHSYVEHNPELKALVERQRTIIDAQQGGNQVVNEELLPFRGAPGNEHMMPLTYRQYQELPWTCVAEGCVWKRRPTRWLKGLDGQLDFAYGVYVHDNMARKLLGPTWAGRRGRDAISDKQYWDDVMAAGPGMGMTFLVAAGRDMPVPEASKRASELIQQRMAAQGVPAEEVAASLDLFAQLLDGKKLLAQSKLLNPLGTHIRRGSTLILTTLPEGTLAVQAMTGDPVRSREHYMLGAMHDAESLCSGLTSLALGAGPTQPQQPPLDRRVPIAAAPAILEIVKGSNDTEADQPCRSLPTALRLGVPKPSMFRLPPVGKPTARPAPLLLSDIGDNLAYKQLEDAFTSAAKAADDASAALQADTAQEVVIATRRVAAQQALTAGLAKLGLDLNIDTAQGGSLLDHASPLQVESRS